MTLPPALILLIEKALLNTFCPSALRAPMTSDTAKHRPWGAVFCCLWLYDFVPDLVSGLCGLHAGGEGGLVALEELHLALAELVDSMTVHGKDWIVFRLTRGMKIEI